MSSRGERARGRYSRALRSRCRTYNDFVRAVQSAKPTVTQEDIKQHLVFAQEGGSE